MGRLRYYHNPRCSKSREALQLLTDSGFPFDVVDYLNSPPSVEELTGILAMLKLSAREFIREKESAFSEKGLADVDSDALLVEAMVDAPVLIERPVLVWGDRAVLGRPPAAIAAFLETLDSK